MKDRGARRARLVAAAFAIPALGLIAAGGGVANASSSHALIQGSGSSWAANAVSQWVADVKSQGLQVIYNPNGDASGRQDFANRTSDFSVTSLGYQGVDPASGISDTSNHRRFAYLPIAAGGTAFPYQIKLHGTQVRNLRLSGETLARIFTGQITNWDNKAITHDNNGHALASLPIIPVVQSEGSGSTAQLTRYFATEYPKIWAPFNDNIDKLTEYWPSAKSGSAQIAQNGSDGAMNYVSSKSANGSIGYVEYSYALDQNYPVVKMRNSANYYTLPTQYNVAVALEKAQINTDKNSPNYLLQNLDHVYTDTDPRAYPLSSYVYEIEPTGTTAQDSTMSTAKRQTIADFTYYSICQGQKEIGPIGYSPLPVNLVEAGFGQLNKLKAADSKVNLSDRSVRTCNNPTFVKGHPSANYLAKIAPLPLSCDKAGAGPCSANAIPSGFNNNPTNGKAPSAKNGNGGGSSKGNGGGGGSSDNSGGGSTPQGGSSSANSGGSGSTPQGNSQAVDPVSVKADSQVAAPAGLAGYRSSHLTKVLAPLAVVLLILALVLPPLIAHQMSRKRRGSA